MAKKRANGEGNIRKRADGRWEGRYTAGYHPETGKRIIKNVLGKTQAECKAKLKKAIEESQALDVGRADEYTVAAWLRTWFELYAKPHIRPSTMNYYHRNIEQHIIPAIGNIPLNKLTTRDLQKLYNDLQSNGRLRKVQKKEKPGLSNSTVRGIHMMLHNALDRAVKEKLILSNPTENCIIPKIEKQEMKILHPDHISAYLTSAERRNALPMFYLELVSGLRKGGLVALQWSDLDEANCTISVSKQASWDTEHQLILSRPKTGNSIREVSIPQDAVELLKQEHAKHPDNPYMFPSPITGEMYYPDSIVNLHTRSLDSVRSETCKRLSSVRERKSLKRNRFLLLSNHESLSPKDIKFLQELFDNYPQFKIPYDLKESFRNIYSLAKSREEAMRFFREWCDECERLKVTAFDKFIGMVYNWQQEIFAYFDYPDLDRTNAQTESFNRSIRNVARDGRGYSFENLRTKMIFREKTPDSTRFDFDAFLLMNDDNTDDE